MDTLVNQIHHNRGENTIIPFHPETTQKVTIE